MTATTSTLTNNDPLGLNAMRAILVCALVPMNPFTAVAAGNTEQPFGVPLVFTGVPGVGKSSTISLLCSLLGVPIADLNFGRILEESLSGMPVMSGPGAVTYACVEPGLRTVQETGEGVIFLDEVNMGDEAMWKYLQSALSTGRIGGLQMPNRVRFVAVRNPPESATSHRDFPIPVANRFVHMHWANPSTDIYQAWRSGELQGKYAELLRRIGGVHSGPVSLHLLESRVEQRWLSHNPQRVGQVAGYLRSRPAHVHSEPKPGSPEADGAWPSPRSWFMLERVLTVCDILGMKEIDYDLMAGCVGNSVALEFSQWITHSDLPDPKSILDGTVRYEIDQKRLDRNMAVYTSLGEYLASMPHSDSAEVDLRYSYAATAWKLLRASCDAGCADTTVQAATTMARNGLATLDARTKDTEAKRACAHAAANALGALSKILVLHQPHECLQVHACRHLCIPRRHPMHYLHLSCSEGHTILLCVRGNRIVHIGSSGFPGMTLKAIRTVCRLRSGQRYPWCYCLRIADVIQYPDQFGLGESIMTRLHSDVGEAAKAALLRVSAHIEQLKKKRMDKRRSAQPRSG